MPDQPPAPELSTLQLPTEHLSSLLTMRTWVKTTLEEERQRCLELTTELEQRQAKIVWLEQTLDTTEKILPDTLPAMPIAESPATIAPTVKPANEPAKSSSPKQPPKATGSKPTSQKQAVKPASQKQATSKQPSAAKPVAKAPVTKSSATKTPATKASKYVPTPQSISSISKATSKAVQSSAKTPQQATSTTGKPSKPSESRQFSIRDVPFLAPYKNNLTVTQAIKALLDDHPDEAMDITQIIERLFGAIPDAIQEQVRRRVTTDLSSGKNTFWRSVPGRRGFYQTLASQ